MDVSSLDFFRRAADGTQTGILYDLMRDEKLIERFPDSSARAHAAVRVVRAAFKIVLKTCDEWGEIKSPRFLNTPTGQRAISKARTEVCRPSLEIDPSSDTKPVSEAVAGLLPTPEPDADSSPDPPVEPEKTLRNPIPQAWYRNHAGKPLHPDAQALLDRLRSGTPPSDVDNEPAYKKAKPLRPAG